MPISGRFFNNDDHLANSLIICSPGGKHLSRVMRLARDRIDAGREDRLKNYGTVRVTDRLKKQIAIYLLIRLKGRALLPW